MNDIPIAEAEEQAELLFSPDPLPFEPDPGHPDPSSADVTEPTTEIPMAQEEVELPVLLAVGEVEPDPANPRRSSGDVTELANDIRRNGLHSPILVRRKDGRYLIVAGERRFRAITQLGWDKVAAFVRELDDQATLEVQISENLQRQDFSPFELADAAHRLITEFGLTQEEVGVKLGGKNQPAVNRLLAIRNLPKKVRQEYSTSNGHATLGTLEELAYGFTKEQQLELWAKIKAGRIPVKELRAARKAGKKSPPPPHDEGEAAAPEIERYESNDDGIVAGENGHEGTITSPLSTAVDEEDDPAGDGPIAEAAHPSYSRINRIVPGPSKGSTAIRSIDLDHVTITLEFHDTNLASMSDVEEALKQALRQIRE